LDLPAIVNQFPVQPLALVQAQLVLRRAVELPVNGYQKSSMMAGALQNIPMSKMSS
jgi:hypothetical protein